VNWQLATVFLIVFLMQGLTLSIHGRQIRRINRSLLKLQSDSERHNAGERKLARGIAEMRIDIAADVTQVFSDPAALDAELEKSAQLTENRRAGRKHLPRENAGPPATVRRLKFPRE
jgi:hypothetical protein